MAKKCEKCGALALDDQSEFCNLCGGFVRESSRINVPVCSRCNSPAPNAEVLFCNRCGMEYPPAEPEDDCQLCPRCGNSIPDKLSVFCNRCGASLSQEPESILPVCGRCNYPAPDEKALFCNRCGTEYKKETQPLNPHCPRCGFLIPDDQSQFCNRCGTAIGPEPINKSPACVKCGAPALDEETLFCNRCGTPFPSAKQKNIKLTVKQSQPVSVKISKKRPVPALEIPEELWDPVPEEDSAQEPYPPEVAPPIIPARKKYAHLPLVADELAGGKIRNESIVIPASGKKYAHLPMIADELKEKKSPRIEIESPYYPGPPREAKTGKTKKGFFDLLKK